MTKSFAFVLTFVAIVLTSPWVHAQCVEVILINDAGEPIIPNGLVTGMMIGDAPVFIAEMPPHRERRPVGPVPCPADLTREVTNLYNLSCTSDTARSQAAETNSTSLEVILQRCNDLRDALKTDQ